MDVVVVVVNVVLNLMGKKRIYIVPLIVRILSKCSDMITVLPANYITPCLPFLRKCSPGGATLN